MGLHAGLYTQQLPNQGRSLARNEDVTHSEAVSLSWREFLKSTEPGHLPPMSAEIYSGGEPVGVVGGAGGRLSRRW